MMLRIATFVVLTLFGSSLAWEAQPGGPPQQGLASLGADEQLQLTTAIEVCVPVQRERTYTIKVPQKRTVEKEVDGRRVQQEVTEYAEETRTQTVTAIECRSEPRVRAFDYRQARYYELDGREADVRTLPQRLAKPTLVVINPDYKPLAEYYAWLFKPGTLVIAPPYEQPVPQVMPAPVPQPPAERAPQPAPGTPQAAGSLPTGVMLVSQQQEIAPALPATVQPRFTFASLTANGDLQFRSFQESAFVTTHQTEMLDDNGQSKQLNFSVEMTNRHSTTVALTPKVVTFSLADGRRVDASQLATLLPRETPVVVSADGKPVDPFWLQNIKPNALVLVAPAGVAVVGMGYGYGHGYYGATGPMPPAQPVQAPPPPQ